MSDDAPSLFVEFYYDAVQDAAKTKLEGRPIFVDQEFVRIKFPGDKQRVHVAPAHERYRRDPRTNDWVTYAEDYPKHYQAFKENREYHGDGTPLSELPFLTEAKRRELRAFNVYTAEALAALDGTPLQRLGMGARELKNQAAAWIEKASGAAGVTRVAAENAALKQQLADLQAAVAELTGNTLAEAGGVEPVQPVEASEFSAMDAASLKQYIKDRTGSAPRGNPSQDTLVGMAVEVANAEIEATA